MLNRDNNIYNYLTLFVNLLCPYFPNTAGKKL